MIIREFHTCLSRVGSSGKKKNGSWAPNELVFVKMSIRLSPFSNTEFTSNQNNFIYPSKSTPKSASAMMNYPSQKISVSISLPASARQTNPAEKTMKSFPKKDRKDENSHQVPETTSRHTTTTISRSRSV